MADKAGDSAAPKEEAVAALAYPPSAAASTAASGEATKGKQEVVEDVPDPDEDDLDDLDDMLDEFSTVKLDEKQPEPSPAAAAAAAPAQAGTEVPQAQLDDVDDVLSDDEFAKQLQAGMADLLGDMGSNPGMQAQFESIFKELGAAAASAGSAAGADAPAGSSKGPASDSAPGGPSASSFQDNIRRTMERMQASGDSATAAATADSEGVDDFMAELLKQAGGEGGEDEFQKMILSMMEQLTNKEILYEPMKELHEKFPGWMEKNRESTPAEDLKKYEEQQGLVALIVAKFEETTYADSNAADREFIVDKMQKMQAAGQPPPDLIGDMPDAQQGLGMPDMEGCNPQ